jgi:hypothetical protein
MYKLKYNATGHKARFISDANCHIFWQQVANIRQSTSDCVWRNLRYIKHFIVRSKEVALRQLRWRGEQWSAVKRRGLEVQQTQGEQHRHWLHNWHMSDRSASNADATLRTETYQTEQKKISAGIVLRTDTYQTEQKDSACIVPRTDNYQTEQKKDSADIVLRIDTFHNYQRRPKLDAE